jgi:DNA polymerase-3 subunit delta'
MIYPWLRPVSAEFEERLAGGRLPHALLLAGPAGTGKTELAAAFITRLLCLEPSDGACGQCRSCRLLGSGAHPDHRLVTFEEHPRTGELRREIVIEQIRRLTAALTLTTTVSVRKSALIVPAEAMNRNTANALLKTLEEPPGDTVLLLVSHDPGRLPATIRSRCQNLNVRLPERQEALQWLKRAADVDDGDAKVALDAAAGSPLVALGLLQAGETEAYRTVQRTLDDLASNRTDPAGALAVLSDVDAGNLWRWLSLAAAERQRTIAAVGRASRPLAELQQSADRGRKLLETPVRKDFLLQDWLIQWARLNA